MNFENEYLCYHPATLRVTNMIDKGAFGLVFKAIDNTTGEIFALKRIPQYATITKNPRSYARKICREVAILSLLTESKCDYIVPLNRVYLSEDKEDVYIQMPFIEYNLHYIVHSRAMVEREVKYVAWQLLAGIKQCHDRHFMHRDLTLKNILLDQWLNVFIADFGLARVKDTSEEEGTIDVVTMEYRPPELLLLFQHYDFRVDIWSLGCMIAEMFLRRRAFAPDHRDTLHQTRKIIQLLSVIPDRSYVQQCAGERAAPMILQSMENMVQQLRADGCLQRPPYEEFTEQLMQSGASAEAADLIKQMLQFDFSNRVTAEQALNHPWFTQDPEYAAEDEDNNNNNNDDDDQLDQDGAVQGNNNEKNMNQQQQHVGEDGENYSMMMNKSKNTNSNNSQNTSSMGSRQHSSHLPHNNNNNNNNNQNDENNSYVSLSRMKVVHSDFADDCGYGDGTTTPGANNNNYYYSNNDDGISKKQSPNSNSNNNAMMNTRYSSGAADGDVPLISKQNTTNSSMFNTASNNNNQMMNRNNSSSNHSGGGGGMQAQFSTVAVGDDGATLTSSQQKNNKVHSPSQTEQQNHSKNVTIASWKLSLEDITIPSSSATNPDQVVQHHQQQEGVMYATDNESNDILLKIQKAKVKQLQRFMESVAEYHNDVIRSSGEYEKLEMIRGEFSPNQSDHDPNSSKTNTNVNTNNNNSSPNSTNHQQGEGMVLQNSQCDE